MITSITNHQIYARIDTMGGQLVSLRDVHGTEYLWQGDPSYWKGQAPILFPIVGSLRDGRTVIGDKSYAMPRHGLARTRSFVRVSERSDGAVFRLQADASTKESYPFDFSLTVAYELAGATLCQMFTVENQGEGQMPFLLGLHPGFNVPLDQEEGFEDYVIAFPLEEDCDSPVLDPESGLVLTGRRRPVLRGERLLPLRHDLFHEDALVLESLRSRKASLYSLVSGRGVEIAFEGFDYFGIWQPEGAPFVCLEPWTGTATCDTEDDLLAHKRGARILGPGESAQYCCKITLL